MCHECQDLVRKAAADRYRALQSLAFLTATLTRLLDGNEVRFTAEHMNEYRIIKELIILDRGSGTHHDSMFSQMCSPLLNLFAACLSRAAYLTETQEWQYPTIHDVPIQLPMDQFTFPIVSLTSPVYSQIMRYLAADMVNDLLGDESKD